MIIADLARDAVAQYEAIFTQFGEIDCGYKIWDSAIEHSVSVEEAARRSVGTYLHFLERHIVHHCKTLCVTAVALPTIPENFERYGEVAACRSTIKQSLRERTDLTLMYNEILEFESCKLGFDFIDAQRYLLSDQTGVIHPEFRHEDLTDHHHNELIIPFWLREIRSFCERNNIRLQHHVV